MKTVIKFFSVMLLLSATSLNATSEPKPAKLCYRIQKPSYALHTPYTPDTLTIICGKLDGIIFLDPLTDEYRENLGTLQEYFYTINDNFETASNLDYNIPYDSFPARWDAFFNSKDYFVHFSGTILRSIIQAIINLPMTEDEAFLFDILDWFYRLQLEALHKLIPRHAYQEIVTKSGEIAFFLDYFFNRGFFLETSMHIIHALPEPCTPSAQAAFDNVVRQLKSIQNTILPLHIQE
jgi:hypothetical protein